jgi:acyl dehydratase
MIEREDTIAQYTFEDICVGQSAEFVVHITQEMVEDFAQLSGDRNPLHMDETFARTTPFNGRVVHGQLGVSFFSRLVGMYLPGRNALYLTQSTSFHVPIRIGMEIIVRGTVTHTTPAAQTLTIKTEILDRHTQTLLTSGTAMVRLLA